MIFTSSILELIAIVVLGLRHELTVEKAILISGVLSIGSIFILFLLFKETFEKSNQQTKSVYSDWRYLISYLAAFQFVFVYRLPASFVINTSEIANLSVAFSFAFMGLPYIYYISQHLKAGAISNAKFRKTDLKLVCISSIFITCNSLVLTFYSNSLIKKTVGVKFSDAALQLSLISASVPFVAFFLFYVSVLQGLKEDPILVFNTIYLLVCTVIILIAGSMGGPVGICLSLLAFHVILGLLSIYKLFSLTLA